MAAKRWEVFIGYWISLVNDVPQYIYEMLFCLFGMATILILACKGIKGGWRLIAQMALMEYLFLVYCSTLIFRTVNPMVGYNFMPLWSYGVIRDNPNSIMLPETVMNVIVFVPMGLLFGMAIRLIKWWKVLLTGGCISVSIEVLQFITKRGFSETDDVMHNTIGCMIGYGTYLGVARCCKYIFGNSKM